MRCSLLALLSLVVGGCGATAPRGGGDGGAPVTHLPSPLTCDSNADAGISDACTKTSDCGAGQACMCSNMIGSRILSGNQCVPADCTSDADCGPHGFCSPSAAVCGAGGTTGLFCHTLNDRCLDYTNCPEAACTWTGQSWECVRSTCPPG